MRDFILGFVMGFSAVAVFYYKDLVAALLLCGIYAAGWMIAYAIKKVGI